MAIRQNYGAALVVASEDSRRKELYAQYDAMCKEVDEKEQKFESLKALFPNGVPAREEFKEQLQFIRNIENKKTKIKGLELNQQECDRWNRLQEMFEIEVPVSNAAGIDGSLYLDIKSLKLDTEDDTEDGTWMKLSDDPDYVNGFLILNSRTINLAAKLLTESIIKRASK
jgi:hypothetical protein